MSCTSFCADWRRKTVLEWIVSSSVLILAAALLRRLLRGKISPRLQYAVWLIVLLRLLVPLNIGSAKVSVQNVVHEADTKISEQVVTYVNYELPDISISEPDPALPEAERETQYEQNVAEYEAQVEAAKAETGTPVTLSDILQYVWYGGMAAMALWFIGTNLVFRARLVRSRKRMEYACRLPVYVTDAVETPCLFGSAVYVTREAAEDAAALRHSVEHELTHHRHGDHIWAVLRCICLVLHWYNPLVWLAAALSRRDAELACDEATIQRLGEAERAAYGRTLIETACEKPATLLRTATTMNCGKSGLKERIRLIAKRPKTAVYAVVIFILAAVIVTGCTFTGAQEKEPAPADIDDFIAANTGLEAGRGQYLAASCELLLAEDTTFYVNSCVIVFELGEDRTLDIAAEVLTPMSLTLRQGEDGGWTQEAFWMPEDGDYNDPELEERFPQAALERLSEQRARSGLPLAMRCFEEAVPALGADVAAAIEPYLSELVESGAAVEEEGGTRSMAYAMIAFYGNCAIEYMQEQLKQPDISEERRLVLTEAIAYIEALRDPEQAPPWSDQYVEGKVNIAVTLTGLSPETPAYYAPEAQDEWRGLLDEAVSKARSGSYVSEGAYLLGQFIVYGGQKLYFNTDGSLSDLDENYLISAADAAPLRELLDETLDSLGVSGHVSPADIHDLRSATFEFYGGTATLTDEAELAEIERILSSSSATYPSQCGFASVMRLERADGTVLSLGMAGDGCGVWQSNGWFYSYPGDNYALYSLLAAQLIHDLDAGTVFSDYYGGALLRYLDWAHYCDKFDYDACFELMDELFEHAKTDYDVMTACLNNTQSLDGALAEAYGYHLVQLYEYAPAEFAAAFHDVPEDQQKVLLNMLTFDLDISSDELRAQLQEQWEEYTSESWSAMSLAELMSTIRAADIEYLACEGPGELTAEQLALALNAAAANQTALDAASFDAWCSLTAYLTDKNGSGAERLVLRAGAEEDAVSVRYETKAGTREGVFEDSELYWLVRNSCSTDLALEAENLEKYRDIIEARAEETVRSAEKTDGSHAFSGYELTRFELMDSFGSTDVRYEVYAWDAAYIPQGDVTTVPLAGGMYVDAEGRVAGYEQDTYFAVKTAADGSFDYRFLTSELFLGPNEALGRESARSYVRAAFTERGWMPVMLCMAADEVLEGLGELPEYGPSEEEYAWKLLLSAREPLYDFKFVRLEPSYTDFTVTETYFETAELSPNTPVILWATFPGDAPQFGLSFRDGSGEQWQLTIRADWSSDEQAVALSTYFMQDWE